jgi:hypothetical protein
MRCPDCGVYSEVPALVKKRLPEAEPSIDDIPTAAAPIPSPIPEAKVEERSHAGRVAALPEAMPVGSEADDGGPYALAGGRERKCPNCNHPLESDAVLCVTCGFNLETGQKAVKVYEKVERFWEAGMPLQKRLRLFALSQCVLLPLALFGAWWGERPLAFLMPWLIFTGLLAFLLGTFDRLDLCRNKRGRVVLTKTWRVFFFPQAPVPIALREYEGVATGPAQSSDTINWVVLVCLLLAGGLPGLLWWLFAFHQESYYVALTQNHGYPELILYQGWSQERAREISQTLHDVAGLPFPLH